MLGAPDNQWRGWGWGDLASSLRGVIVHSTKMNKKDLVHNLKSGV